MPIIIKKCNLNILDELHKLSKKTFVETYVDKNTAGDVKKHLKTNFNKAKVKDELSTYGSVFYAAIEEKNLAGYMKVNYGRAQTDLKDKNWLEIERIYILKEFQGRKIGRLLLKKAIDLSKELSLPFIWLGVWERNPRAIKFYKHNGFVKFDTHTFQLGNDQQKDTLMKYELK